MLQREQDLQNLLEIREQWSKDKKSDYAVCVLLPTSLLHSFHPRQGSRQKVLNSDMMLDDIIKKLQASIKRARHKEEGPEEEVEVS